MKKKRFFAVILVLFMMCSVVPVNAAVPPISNNCYIKTYPLSTKNNTYVYTSSALTTNGTSSPYKAYNAVIYASDEVYIYRMNDTWAYISYPTSSGRRYGYVRTSDLTLNNSSQTAMSSRANITTYRRAGQTKYGSIYKGDKVYKMAVSGNYTQVIYEVSGGYKMAWIKTSDYNNYIQSGYKPEGCLDSITSNGKNKIAIKGWCVDRDEINTSLLLHIYVGGPAGDPNATGYIVSADAYRADVHKDHGVGYYHGIDCTLEIEGRSGECSVYVYAINAGAGDSNTYMGMSTVTLGGSSEKKISLAVPSYKQYDSRWSGTYIGNKTIGSVGCLITSLAMKYSYHTNTTTYPNTMRYKLQFSNNDLYWSSVSNLGYKYTGIYGCKVNESILKTIYQKLSEGTPVIVGGKNNFGGMHWVIVTGYKGSGTGNFSASDFTINDPNSSSRTNLQQFFNSYPRVERLIY